MSVSLDGQLVKDVSRSFYLTLRLLPQELRELISLAYLLARASDTIADTASVPLVARRDCLQRFQEDFFSGGEVSTTLQQMVQQSFYEQRHEGERVLMQALSPIFHATQRFSATEQEMVRAVIGTIVEGQLWDLDYFQQATELQQVQDAESLERYTYQVAGCVGEFWTRALHEHGHIPEEQYERMVEQGIRYGKGLQLTNIIRDIPEDYANGRVYIPEVAPQSCADVVQASAPWLERAESYLADGIHYSEQLRRGRLRTATVLPARLGVKTLALLRATPVADRATTKVKITRKAVFMTLAKSWF